MERNPQWIAKEILWKISEGTFEGISQGIFGKVFEWIPGEINKEHFGEISIELLVNYPKKSLKDILRETLETFSGENAGTISKNIHFGIY